MWKTVCNQHQPTKLSAKAITPTTVITTLSQFNLNTGVHGPSHQKAKVNRNTLSVVPKFCFMFSPFSLQNLTAICLHMGINQFHQGLNGLLIQRIMTKL